MRAGTQAQWLQSQIRLYVAKTREKLGEDFDRLLIPEEEEIVRVMERGAWTIPDIVRETMLREKRVRDLLEDLVERRIVQKSKQGGRSEVSKGKGPVTALYSLIPR